MSGFDVSVKRSSVTCEHMKSENWFLGFQCWTSSHNSLYVNLNEAAVDELGL